MYYRRKILLSLLKEFGGRLAKIDFQKYLFLFNIQKSRPYFDFIPYKYGCFSYQADQDMSTMIKYNLVEETEKEWLIRTSENYMKSLVSADKVLLSTLYHNYHLLKGRELLKYVYGAYPYYAINSIVAKDILNAELYKNILDIKINSAGSCIATIGYEGKTIELFTNQLIRNDIKVLCDIRKNALSMKFGFSKNKMRTILENVGIKYVHIPELGIESDKRQRLLSGEDYRRLFKDYEDITLVENDEALSKVYDLFNEYKRISLMCFEADSLCCHRSRTLKSVVNKFNINTDIINL